VNLSHIYVDSNVEVYKMESSIIDDSYKISLYDNKVSLVKQLYASPFVASSTDKGRG